MKVTRSWKEKINFNTVFLMSKKNNHAWFLAIATGRFRNIFFWREEDKHD